MDRAPAVVLICLRPMGSESDHRVGRPSEIPELTEWSEGSVGESVGLM